MLAVIGISPKVLWEASELTVDVREAVLLKDVDSMFVALTLTGKEIPDDASIDKPGCTISGLLRESSRGCSPCTVSGSLSSSVRSTTSADVVRCPGGAWTLEGVSFFTVRPVHAPDTDGLSSSTILMISTSLSLEVMLTSSLTGKDDPGSGSTTNMSSSSIGSRGS